MKIEDGDEIVSTTRIRRKRSPARKADWRDGPIGFVVKLAALAFVMYCFYMMLKLANLI